MSERNLQLPLPGTPAPGQQRPVETGTTTGMSFWLDCIPTPQLRPRHAHINGHDMTFKSKSQQANENTLEALLLPWIPEKPMEGPLKLSIMAYFPIPKSWSKKKRQEASKGEMRHTSKPDLDNLFKQVKDCMTRLRFWGDDRQISDYGQSGKRYGERPGWHITVIGL